MNTYIFSNFEIIDLSFNSILSYSKLLDITQKNIDKLLVKRYSPALYRAVIFLDYIYIYLDGNLYRISKSCFLLGCICEEDVSLQLDCLDYRIGGIVIINSKIYILETSFSRIRCYDIDKDGNITKESLTIPNIYPKIYKLPFDIQVTEEFSNKYLLYDYIQDGFEVITKLFISSDFPDKLICVNSNKSLDIVDINTYSVQSIDISNLGVSFIDNIAINNNKIYYNYNNSLYMYDIADRKLYNSIINFNIYGNIQNDSSENIYQSGNLWLVNNKLYYSMRYISFISSTSKSIIFTIDTDNFSYSLREYDNLMAYSPICQY